MFKKFIKENMLVAEGGESSSTHKPTAEDLDYELARQLQKQEDADAAALSTGPAKDRSKPPVSSSPAPSHRSAYPKVIREDLEYVQEFAKDIMRARCRKCNTELMAAFRGSEWLQRWQAALKRNEVFSFPAAKCGVTSCGAMTCVGCAREPRIGKHTAEFDGELVDWCCSDGRLFAIWILLSKYDKMELEVQARSAEKSLQTSKQAAEREFKPSSGRATLKLAGRIIEVYDNLAPRKSRERKDDKKGEKRIAWTDYNKRNAINMEDNVIGYLSRPLQNKARFLGYSPRERLKWLVTETAEMSTSLPPNIFVKVDSVRPDVMKCLIVGPDDTPGGLFESGTLLVLQWIND